MAAKKKAVAKVAAKAAKAPAVNADKPFTSNLRGNSPADDIDGKEHE